MLGQNMYSADTRALFHALIVALLPNVRVVVSDRGGTIRRKTGKPPSLSQLFPNPHHYYHRSLKSRAINIESSAKQDFAALVPHSSFSLARIRPGSCTGRRMTFWLDLREPINPGSPFLDPHSTQPLISHLSTSPSFFPPSAHCIATRTSSPSPRDSYYPHATQLRFWPEFATVKSDYDTSRHSILASC
jgi:hypothetical protein